MIYRDAVSPAENQEPAARPARRRLPPDDRRQALINSALKLFNTHPYDEVSVDDIAAEAGVSRPLVYHYYGGRRGYSSARCGRRATTWWRPSPKPGWTTRTTG